MEIKKIIKKILSKTIGYNNFTKIKVLFLCGIKYFPILGYSDIDGWFTPKEAMALYDIVTTLTEESPVVCEIGSWLGRSSVILSKGISGKKNPKLYCIDPFNADSDAMSMSDNIFKAYKSKKNIDLKSIFISNIKKNKVENIINIMQGYSHDIVKNFDGQIDMVLIDGNHDYDFVLKDYLDWSGLVKIGGFIAFHDSTLEGPSKVINEFVDSSPSWEIVKRVDDILIAKKHSK